MSEQAAADRRARRLAREEFEHPVVLEAGAGTGKTTALVTRLLAWCLGAGWQRHEAALRSASAEASAGAVARRVLRGVVAITFTEAAAAEMGVRCAEALRDVEAGRLPAGLPPDALAVDAATRRARAAALRGALDHLSLQTIHAWCRRLLAAHPLEARLHPQLEVDADQRVQQELVREVLEDRLAEAYAPPGDPRWLALAQRGVGPPQLESQLLALLDAGVPASQLELDPLAPERIEGLVARCAAACEALATAADGALHRVSRSAITLAVAEALDETRARLREAPICDVASLERLTAWLAQRWVPPQSSDLLKRLREWTGSGFNRSETQAFDGRGEAIRAAAATLAPLLAHLCRLDPRRLDLGRRVLAELLAETEQRLRARGVATFAQLLSGAAELLASRPEVAAAVRGRIDQLLVDEFQDTDRRQCRIVGAVGLEGPRSERPGLFLVGDPKQSIYGWRSADLEAYHDFRDRVRAEGGVVEKLSLNFRSVPAILDEVERVLAPRMLEHRGVQPGFERLVPSREGAAAGSGAEALAPVEYWHSGGWDAEQGKACRLRAAEAAGLEAQALARDLRALHDAHGVAWKQIGVLFRSRGDLETYLAELRRSAVPYAVEGDRSYFQRREVIEAACLVRCVLDPNDQLALLGWLRSSAVGVPDAALVPLFRHAFPSRFAGLSGPNQAALAELEQLAVELADGLPDDVPGLERVAGWERNLVATVRQLAELRRSFRRDAVDVFVEKLRERTLFDVGEGARYLGAWRVANLDRFFRELAEHLAEGVTPDAELRRLRRAVVLEEQQEEGRPKDVVEDAVQVMTIHGAKGLDFDHVYVMQLHKGAGRDDREGVRAREIEGRLEYRLLGSPTPGFDLVVQAEQTVAEAEQVRALYVALTRARERLVIAGQWPVDGEARSPMRELFGQRRLAPPELPELMREAATVHTSWLDRAEARWRFPALAAATPSAAREPPRHAEPPSPERVARDAEALRLAREAARQRELRGFGGTASGLAHTESLTEQAARRLGEARRPGATPADGARARAVGTAVHRALERLELEADLPAQLRRAAEGLEGLLADLVDARQLDAAVRDARGVLLGLSGGRLLARLQRVGVLHRELSLLAPVAEGEDGPVSYVAGQLDLVYRDPDSGRLVVADYKTDRAEGAALEQRRAAYARQGAVYQRALREAFGLDYTPRFELWWLRRDEISCLE